ncbi:MAG: hypothetical protein HQM10_07195 [Candidatus Riflebacteria bacterium]|nr:hypothetical protein [Candidatus Riflebacteria bacterium]
MQDDINTKESIEREEIARKDKKPGFLSIVFFVIPVFLIVSVAVAFFTLKAYLTEENISGFLQGVIKQHADLPLEVKGIQFDFPNALVSEVNVNAGGKSSLRIKNLKLAPNWSEIFSGKVSFSSISIDEGSLKLLRNSSGAIVLADNKVFVMPENASSQEQATGSDFLNSLPFRNILLNNLSAEIFSGKDNEKFNCFIEKASLSDSMLKSGKEVLVVAKIENLIEKLNLNGELKSDFAFSGNISVNKPDLIRLSEITNKKIISPFSESISIDSAVSYNPSGKLSFDLGMNKATAEAIPNNKLSGKLSLEKLVIKDSGKEVISGNLYFTSFSPLGLYASLAIAPMSSQELKKIFELSENESLSKLDLKQGKISGKLELLINDKEKTGFKTEFKVDNMTLAHPSMPVSMEKFSTLLKINSSSITFADAKFQFSGNDVNISNFEYLFTEKLLDAKVIIRATCENIMKIAKEHVPVDYLPYIPSGKVSYIGKISGRKLDISLSGILESDYLEFKDLKPVSDVKIKNVTIKLHDLGKEKGKAEFEKLVVSALGIPLTISGHILNSKDPKLNITGVADIDFGKIYSFAGDKIAFLGKDSKFSGKISAETKITGSISKISPVLNIQSDNLGISIPKYKIDVNGMQLSGAVDKKGVTVQSASGKIGKGTFTVEGKVTDYVNPIILAAATIDKMDLKEVRAILQTAVSDFPSEIDLKGQADMTLSIKGKASLPEIKGNAIISSADFFHPAIFRILSKINGKIDFDNDSFSTKQLNADWGSSSIQISGKVSDFSAFSTALTYSIKPLNLTDTASFFLKDTGYSITGNGEGQGKISGPLEKIKVDGSATFPSGSLEAPVSTEVWKFAFPYTDLKADFAFTQGVLDIKKASGNFFSGKILTSGKIFLLEKPIRFVFNTSGSNLAVQEFLSKNTRLKNELEGNLNFSSKLSFSSLGLDSIDGDLTSDLKNGSYKSPPVMSDIFKILQATNLSQGKISESKGFFTVKNGKFSSDDLVMKSQYGTFSFKGKVGLDTSIDGVVNLSIANSACQSSSLLKKLVGKSASLDLPAKIRGSAFNPKIDLNYQKLLENAAKEQLQDKLNDQIGNLLGISKKKPEVVPAQPSGSASASENVKSTKDAAVEAVTQKLFEQLGIKQKKPQNTQVPEQPSGQTMPVEQKPEAQKPVEQKPEEKVTPQKAIKNEIKKLESGLKNLFKF